MKTKKAFTLAEVLITLSILGVVAALTIPSLVNRQSQMAAIVKLKKAISQFEQVTEVYMAENEATTMNDMIGSSCANLTNYFKIAKEGADACQFTTADGVQWNFTYDASNGNYSYVVVYDSDSSPKYGVAMRADDGAANKSAVDAAKITSPAADVYKVADFLSVSKPNDISGLTKLKAKS